jgi:hypothetical protein
MRTFSLARRFACVPIFLAAALALWLSTAPAGHATTATQTQGVQVTVASGGALTWGSAGGCIQNMAAADFGSMQPASAANKGPFTGCVTTSTGVALSVSVAMTTLLTSGANTIPASDLAIGGGQVPTGSTAGCLGSTTTGCVLGTPATLFTNGPTSGTVPFSYELELQVPSGQAPGAYTGGLLTFTATA